MRARLVFFSLQFELSLGILAIAKYLVKEASSNWKAPVSLVSVLTESNFTEWVERHEISLVEFYAPG